MRVRYSFWLETVHSQCNVLRSSKGHAAKIFMVLRILGLVLALALAAYGLMGPAWFSAPAEQAERAALKVAAEKLNVRKSASTNSEIVGELKMGDKVTVVEEGEAGWVKVSSAKLQGWVKRSFLSD
jgi:uncharacterized protein YgiM (DUF1202 family)